MNSLPPWHDLIINPSPLHPPTFVDSPINLPKNILSPHDKFLWGGGGGGVGLALSPFNLFKVYHFYI